MDNSLLKQHVSGSSYENLILDIGETRAITHVGKRAKWLVLLWGIGILGVFILILIVSPGIVQLCFFLLLAYAFFSTFGLHRKIVFDLQTAEVRRYAARPIFWTGAASIQSKWSLQKLQHLEFERRVSATAGDSPSFECGVLTAVFEGGETLTILNHAVLLAVKTSAKDLSKFLGCELKFL